jgi:hypothetical protein
MISAKGAVDFHCSAFIDFWLQADKDEMKWLKTLFGCIAPQQLFDKKIKCILILDRTKCNITRQGVSGVFQQRVLATIRCYPWTLRSDDSASRLLTRDVLIHVYSQLKDPNDMWAFMRVNKLFHKAGCAYTGYAEKIERLKKYSGVKSLPFTHLSTDRRRHFFALCFVSCKKNLEKQLIASATMNSDVFNYCHYLAYPNDRMDTLYLFTQLTLDGVLVVRNTFTNGVKTLLGGRDSQFRWLLHCIRKALQ